MMKVVLQWEYQPVFEGILFNWMLLSMKNTIIEKGSMFVDIILYGSKMKTKSITSAV